ncbi:MAG: aminotransferase class IV family protein [Paracoccaceae bacterium]
MESALRQAAGEPGLKLIETMLWDGAGVPRLPLHLARLRDGAQAFGWVLPDFSPSGPSGSPARLRLTLDAHGCLTVETGALPPARTVWRLGLATERLSSSDPWLTVKSTRRAVYDRARATLDEELDELVFQNEHGEVCDGTITTVFFDRGAGLRTPPLRCGLLPGVLRAEVGCPEEVLLAEDLPKVRLWVGNAVRGMSKAVWCG